MSRNRMRFIGKFKSKCFDKNGKLKWIEESKNITVDEGLINNLNVYFKASAQTATWYIGLIGSNSTPIAGWDAAGIGSDFTEFVNYSEATREEWVEGSVTAKALNNTGNEAEFNVNGAGGTVYGAFMISNNTKGGTSGIMWCASLFASSRPVVSGDIVTIEYTITIADV